MMPEMGTAVGAVIEAGKRIMEIYKTEFPVSSKGDDSPITEADLESNDIVRRALAETGHMILSEENPDDVRRLSERRLWVVDPLDGTADFVGRTGEFTVMIALVLDGRPALGVIGNPARQEIFAAQAGHGAFVCRGGAWSRMAVSQISEIRMCRVVGSRHHLSDWEQGFIGSLNAREFTGVGSSLKACMISAGDAEIYISITDKMKEWDTAASCCIVSEAGGRFTDIHGRPMTYNNPDVRHRSGILVTNGLVHNQILDMLDDVPRP